MATAAALMSGSRVRQHPVHVEDDGVHDAAVLLANRASIAGPPSDGLEQLVFEFQCRVEVCDRHALVFARAPGCRLCHPPSHRCRRLESPPAERRGRRSLQFPSPGRCQARPDFLLRQLDARRTPAKAARPGWVARFDGGQGDFLVPQTRRRVSSTSSGLPGSNRQFTRCAAVWGKAPSAWPPSISVATAVVRREGVIHRHG